MSKKSKIIVIDANILIRAVLGIRTFSLIAEHSTHVMFCTPKTCYLEVAHHIPNIAKNGMIYTTPDPPKGYCKLTIALLI